MGIAAYNRGSRVIRDRLDREAAERRIVKPARIAAENECEYCFAQFTGLSYGPLGLRPQTWSNRLGKWLNACHVCRNRILRGRL